MCGVGAMLGNADSLVLERMNILQSHRGPDGARTWVDDDCGLAHTRLAIVDIVGSDQPISSDHGALLVHNGEIYNQMNIRNKNRKYPWRTAGDSETILALHSKFTTTARKDISASDVMELDGILISNKFNDADNPAVRHREWISQLNGIWGFILWDSNARELVLSRDIFGVKPLIRAYVNGSLLVSSEIKAMRAHEEYIPQFDIAAIAARLAYEYPLDQTTLVNQATQLGAGSIETWGVDSEGRAVLTGVSSLGKPRNDPDEHWNPSSEIPSLLRSFQSSLTDRMMSDVPVGIVLSGGLDSSLVAALAHDAAETAGKPVPECWTTAESEDNPDWIAAEEVAKSFDLAHHQHILDADSFNSILPTLAWHGEDLDVTVLFFQPLFKRMSQHVKVGLCGQGADELHAGYPRYASLQEHSALVAGRLNSYDSTETLDSSFGVAGPALRWDRSSYSPEHEFSSLRKCLDFELQHGQLTNFQLRLVDRHSMAHGLEVRVPFLGSSHWDASRRIPMEWRLPSDPSRGIEKRALREAATLTNLPKSIIDRPKLPAGRATSPHLVDNFLAENQQQIESMLQRYSHFSKMLKGQEEIALGLGMFEALHILDGGARYSKKSVDDIIDAL